MPRSKHAPKKTRKPRKRTSNPTFSTYIYKVLKQVHPDVGLSNHAMTIMNDFVHFTLRRVAAQAQILVDAEKAKTIDSRAIQTAVRLELPGELAKHAVSEGTKAVTKWSAAQGTKGSLSKKAGLQFPVSRCKAQLRKYTSADRIGNGAAVYLAAICEYMTAEILELAGNASKDLKVKRVTPRHITLAVRGDEELDHFLDGVTIRGGGVIPHIHKSLIAKSSGSMSSFGAPSTSFGNTSIFGQGFGSTAMPLGQGFGATTTPASTSFGNTAIFGQGFGTGTTTPASGFGQSLPGTTVFSVNTPGGFTFGGAPQGGFSFGTATGPANPLPNFGALNIKDEDEDGEDEEDEE